MTTPAYEPGSDFSNQTGFRRFIFLLTTLCLLLFTYLALGFALFSIIGLAMEGRFDVSLLCIVLFMLMICGSIFGLMWHMIRWFFTRYRFEHDGLRIKHPLQRSKLIPWTDFQKVGVYFSNHNPHDLTRPDNICLCCVHKRAKKNLRGYWSLTHSNKVITMRYSPELYAGLCEMCTIPVTDLRLEYRPRPAKDPWR